ncbi:MAG: hypothetical protein COW01_12610 [Bdellovibrionales bacterium CG12_big_fil_rev_8_21_14_0_65_38_15]|nr:MAG: hypothetical protein COW79_13925 [Bdellovibrionales bacterium CG22_combo_CG10-13_8_21_14_all_38_13]PIQ53832.1 MAG: hypothetical protein COW01_12610 [Bdellovibrionales bacterium CG12_big_fil_rev_8_21_14_0_65_38_15]PIR30891.1 MAG: hypothetical protein COV38_03235 [Bdellovibrionales bacterium CG11_big_fil_rev_8_21_14_0_20_38_13]
MKFIAISIIYLISFGLMAQDEEIETKEKILSRQDFYSGQSYSLIDWEKLDTVQWLDFDEWKDDSALKDREPRWRRNLRERGLVEQVGLGLECVGDCQVFRGSGSSLLRFRSGINEGDEIVTAKDSYAWIFLMDGTMLRVSPNTSISFKEINISAKVVFHHARLNYGHALWISRQTQTFEPNNLKETDPLFLPLNYFEANLFSEVPKVNDAKFYVDVERTPIIQMQYERLNKLIEENNQWHKGKETVLFLVMQNGTVVSKNPILEAISLSGNESFVKNRTMKEIGLKDDRETSATAYMRGFDNTSSENMDTGTWYRFDQRGREFSKAEDELQFAMAEYITLRIPTIYVARELMLAQRSQFIYQEKTRLQLAAENGYRLWSGDLESGEIESRAKFMLEYSRRSETTQLIETDKFNRIMTAKGEKIPSEKWSDAFYLKAIDAYALAPVSTKTESNEGEILNSTTKPLWKIMNARKNF